MSGLLNIVRRVSDDLEEDVERIKTRGDLMRIKVSGRLLIEEKLIREIIRKRSPRQATDYQIKKIELDDKYAYIDVQYYSLAEKPC